MHGYEKISPGFNSTLNTVLVPGPPVFLSHHSCECGACVNYINYQFILVFFWHYMAFSYNLIGVFISSLQNILCYLGLGPGKGPEVKVGEH